ncbi:MAG TPA: acyl-CoA dehydrogenase, partial [Proteobacteria bacterium]|nr:acyl-CoA dehydrogenase [Pseudomonadota bacterium]
MAHYKVDERDVRFVLNEYLKVGDLTKYPRFDGFSAEDFDMVITEALKFAQTEIAELNEESDSVGARFEDGKVLMPEGFHRVYKTFGENGWIGIAAPPDLGGQGFPFSVAMAAWEFFSGACCAFTLTPHLTAGAADLIATFGSDELKQIFCEKMYSGVWAGTMDLTEPQAGSDVGAIRTAAKPLDPDKGLYKIVGNKIFISGGDHDLTENIIHLVLARIEGAPKGIWGVSLFVVPKYRVNPDGSIGEFNDISCISIEEKMGIHGSPTCVLNFGDNDNCIGQLVGEPHKGIKYMFLLMNEARLFVGLQGVSLAATAYMNALDYAKERIQFRHLKDDRAHDAPPVPIIEHPDVRRMLMFMKSVSEATRAMLYKAAYHHDIAHASEDEKEREYHQDMVDLLTPICKAYGSDMAFRVTEYGIQVFGGYGYCREYPMEQYCRDVKIASIYEGTNGIQALDLLGRKLTLKKGQLFMSYMQELAGFIDSNTDHPKLAKYVKKLADARDVLAQVTLGFGGMIKNPDEFYVPFLNACPYLEMFGHVLSAHLLLDMAVVADRELNRIFEEKGAGTDEARREIVRDHD